MSSRTSADAIRERYERVKDEVGPGVTVVVATKYLGVEELGLLAEAGVDVVGENRAQDLEAKHERFGDAFRWHFIGHLQSRKAKTVNAICELCHSLDSESAARKLTVPALVEVNLSGEPTTQLEHSGARIEPRVTRRRTPEYREPCRWTLPDWVCAGQRRQRGRGPARGAGPSQRLAHPPRGSP